MIWLQFYVMKLAIQLPWVVICVGAALHVRRDQRWPKIAQVAGAGILVGWMLLDWILMDPHIGIFDVRYDPPSWLASWVTLQSVVTGLGMVSFGIGYLVSSAKAHEHAAGAR